MIFLINGYWRNDFEILANNINYHDAAIYHGLSDPYDESNETFF